jgi:galacturonosyltransferase
MITFLYKFALKKTYFAFFQNESNLGWFKNNINKNVNTILVNGSGVNLNEFPYSDYPEGNITKFLFLGRIMKDKGVDELIYASRKIKEKYGSLVEIKIAGFFEEDYQMLITDLQNQGIIEYTGYLDSSLNSLKDSSAIVLPSYHEGLSNVLLEAQAVGRAVIASNISGCVETFIDNKSGYTVEVKNKEDLYFKMEQFHLLSIDKKREMGYFGRLHVEKKFNRDEVIEKYFNVII